MKIKDIIGFYQSPQSAIRQILTNDYPKAISPATGRSKNKKGVNFIDGLKAFRELALIVVLIIIAAIFILAVYAAT